MAQQLATNLIADEINKIFSFSKKKKKKIKSEKEKESGVCLVSCGFWDLFGEKDTVAVHEKPFSLSLTDNYQH